MSDDKKKSYYARGEWASKAAEMEDMNMRLRATSAQEESQAELKKARKKFARKHGKTLLDD